jgi:hypothetical protein
MAIGIGRDKNRNISVPCNKRQIRKLKVSHAKNAKCVIALADKAIDIFVMMIYRVFFFLQREAVSKRLTVAYKR